MCEFVEDVIKIGHHVIVRKQNFGKVYKVTANGNLMLGKDQVSMSEIIGKPFWSTFEMISTASGKRTFSLKVVPEAESWDDLKAALSSGFDNRSITDDGTSQKLSKEEILELQNTGKTGKEIVGTLIENSSSFLSKTEYSQAKYIKKKERKYSKYLTIHKPTITSLHEIYFKLHHNKIGDLRMDMLAQLLSYSDIQSSGLHILYDSGFHGLPTAAMLNRMGANTDGILINLHPGNIAPSTIVQAMNFPQEQKDRLISVNIYSFLRSYYQESAVSNDISKPCDLDIQDNQETHNGQTVNEKPIGEVQHEHQLPTSDDNGENSVLSKHSTQTLKRKEENSDEPVPMKKPKWFVETQHAIELLRNTKARGLTIVAREHPLNIVEALLPFLGPSRPFVIFHLYREPLQAVYIELKQKPGVVNLRLFTNFFRSYQVLPDRTHPDILTNDTSGYLLTGYVVNG